MRRAALVLAAGVFALVLQGGLAGVLPAALCPDLGLLVVVAIGLAWERSVPGLALAAALGYAADLLSGTLLGQHALLRLLAFWAARLASRKLNLRGAIPLAVFGAGLSLANGLGLLAITRFFGAQAGPDWAWLADAIGHSLVTGACAPAVAVALERLLAWAGDEDSARRSLRLAARGREA